MGVLLCVVVFLCVCLLAVYMHVCFDCLHPCVCEIEEVMLDVTVAVCSP